jgi:hypothetical protein
MVKYYVTTPMTVSVVICTRNRGTLIEATLQSILAGTRRPDDFLVVDQSDGIDNREAVARVAAGAEESPIRYLPISMEMHLLDAAYAGRSRPALSPMFTTSVDWLLV